MIQRLMADVKQPTIRVQNAVDRSEAMKCRNSAGRFQKMDVLGAQTTIQAHERSCRSYLTAWNAAPSHLERGWTQGEQLECRKS